MSTNQTSASEDIGLNERLQVRLVSGETGKVVYDSEKDKRVLGFPTKPLKYCGVCGSEVQPVIYMCPCCRTRYVQMEDKKTGRIVMTTLPPEADETKEPPPDAPE